MFFLFFYFLSIFTKAIYISIYFIYVQKKKFSKLVYKELDDEVALVVKDLFKESVLWEGIWFVSWDLVFKE